MKSLKSQIKEKIVGKMSRDELLESRIEINHELFNLKKSHESMKQSFQLKLKIKDDLISQLTTNNEVKELNILDKKIEVRNLQDALKERKHKMMMLDAEEKFLKERVREKFGAYVLANLMFHHENPREFTNQDHYKMVNGNQAKKYKTRNIFKIFYRNWCNLFLEVIAIFK